LPFGILLVVGRIEAGRNVRLWLQSGHLGRGKSAAPSTDYFPAESPKPEAVANKGTGHFIPKSTGAQSVACFRDSSISRITPRLFLFLVHSARGIL
jgi:hypothetical protein